MSGLEMEGSGWEGGTQTERVTFWEEFFPQVSWSVSECWSSLILSLGGTPGGLYWRYTHIRVHTHMHVHTRAASLRAIQILQRCLWTIHPGVEHIESLLSVFANHWKAKDVICHSHTGFTVCLFNTSSTHLAPLRPQNETISAHRQGQCSQWARDGEAVERILTEEEREKKRGGHFFSKIL